MLSPRLLRNSVEPVFLNKQLCTKELSSGQPYLAGGNSSGLRYAVYHRQEPDLLKPPSRAPDNYIWWEVLTANLNGLGQHVTSWDCYQTEFWRLEA